MSSDRTHNDKEKSSFQIIETDINREVTPAEISHQLTQPNDEEIEPKLIENSPSVVPEPEIQELFHSPAETGQEKGGELIKVDTKSRNKPQRTSIWQQLKARTTAILVGAAVMLPILALGTVTYYFADKAIAKQTIFARRLENRELSEAELVRQEKLLAALLIGTGTTALLAGALATWGTKRLLDDKSQISTEEPDAGVETQASNLVKRFSNETVPTQLLNSFTFDIRDLARGELLRERFNELELLKIAVEKARTLIELDRAMIYQFDDDWNGTIVAESVIAGYPKALYSQVKDPCFSLEYAEKYCQGRIQVIRNIDRANLAACHLEQLRAFAVKASLVIPIIQDGRLFGLFIGHQCSQPRSWEQSSIDLFAQLALQLGLALERVKLKEELSQIQNLQSHEANRQQPKTESDQSLSINDLIKKFEQDTANLTGNPQPQKQLSEGETIGEPQNVQQNQDLIPHSKAIQRGLERESHEQPDQKVIAETTKKIELLNQSHQNISQMVSLINEMKEKMQNNPD